VCSIGYVLHHIQEFDADNLCAEWFFWIATGLCLSAVFLSHRFSGGLGSPQQVVRFKQIGRTAIPHLCRNANLLLWLCPESVLMAQCSLLESNEGRENGKSNIR